MFNNLNLTDNPTAMGEMAIMLIGSFLLGYLFHHWFVCKNEHQVTTTTTRKFVSSAADNDDETPDDLQKIEGIGPAIERLLNAEGIMTFAQLANTTPSRIKSILEDAGSRFAMHDPATWPQQARLARDGKWDEFELLTAKLVAGKVKK